MVIYCIQQLSMAAVVRDGNYFEDSNYWLRCELSGLTQGCILMRQKVTDEHVKIGVFIGNSETVINERFGYEEFCQCLFCI